MTARDESIRSIVEQNTLVVENQGLLWYVWRREKHLVCMRRLGCEDAIAAGQLGLIRAAEKWRPEVAQFNTYAAPWVWCKMQRAAETAMTIRIPIGVLQGRASDRCKAAARNAGRVYSSSIHPDKEEYEPFLSEDQTPSMLLDGWGELMEAMRFVHRSNREPLLAHYRDGLTLDEIAASMSVSRERVRQLVEKGLDKLRERLGNDAVGFGSRRRQMAGVGR